MTVAATSSSKLETAAMIIGLCLLLLGAFYYFRPPEISIPTISYLSGFFLPMIVMLYLCVPTVKKKEKIAWYDICLGVLGGVACGYIVINGKELESAYSLVTPWGLSLGCIMLVIIAEGVRRTLGWAMTILMIVLCIQPLIGSHLPGILHVRSIGISTLINAVFLTSSGMFGVLLNLWAKIILPFMFLGQLLIISGGGQIFFDVASSLVGRTTGGPAKIAVIASACMGTMTGGPIPNIAITGQVTIPIMKKLGYRPEFAGAVETAASTGGSIMPPIMGMVSFVMADFLGIPYATICLAAVIPAVAYYMCIFAQVHFEAQKMNLSGLPRDQIPSFWESLRKGWNIILVLLSLIFFLIILKLSPGRCGYYTIIIYLVVSAFSEKTRVGLKKILEAAGATVISMLPLTAVMAAAGVIMASFGATGLGVKLTHEIVDIAGNSVFALLLLAAVLSFIMGMGLPAVVSYTLLAILIGPILTKGGIPSLAAHFFFFWSSIWAHITPPVALACFVAAPIANAKFWPLAWRTTLLALPMYILPFVFVYNPAILTLGSPVSIVLVFIGSVISVILVAAGVEGYFIKKSSLPQRIVLLICGSILLILTAKYA
jgi:TRAP transporter 4TM/12TM fusion protein